MLVAVLVTVSFGAAVAREPSSIANCLTSAAKISPSTQFTLPENAKPTADDIALEVEVDSAGRALGVHVATPSGDPAVDLALRQIVQNADYTPAQTGCVAYSGAAEVVLPLRPGSGSFTATAPLKRDPTCTPFVNAFISPKPRDRKHTATAIVDVPLDAAATRTGPPVLRHGTGDSALDAEAMRLATHGHYQFVPISACTPQALTFQMELTFE